MHRNAARIALGLAAFILPAADGGSAGSAGAADAYNGPYVSPTLSVRDVNVATVTGWLRRFGVDVPIALTGRVSASLTVGVPVLAPRTGRAYRLDGTLTSPALIVEGVELRDVSMTLIYRDGVMRIVPLSFRVVDPREQAAARGRGTFVGRATLQLLPPGRLSLGLVISRVPVPVLVRQIAGLPELAAGEISGSLAADVPLNEAAQIASWRANGRVALSGWQMFDRTLSAADARFDLRDAGLSVADLTGELEGVELSGSGTLKLTAPFEYTVSLTAAADELARVNRLLREELIPGTIRGQPTIAAQADGTLSPFVYRATADAGVRELQSAELELGDVSVVLFATPERITLTEPRITPKSGQIEARLSAGAPTDELDRLNAWTATAEIDVRDWQVAEQRVQSAAALLKLESGMLDVLRLRLEAGAVSIDGAGHVNLAEPFAYDGGIELQLSDVARLAELDPQFTWLRNVSGRLVLDADVRGTARPFGYEGRADAVLTGVRFGTLEIASAGLTITADRERIHLRELTVVPHRGRFSGTLEAQAPKARIGDPAAWQVTGAIRLEDWPISGRTIRSAAVDVRVSEGRLSVPQVSAELTGASLSGSAEVSLAGSLDFSADLDVRIEDLARAAELVPEVELPIGVAGNLRVDASARGTLRPLRFDATGEAVAEDLVLEPVKVDTAETRFELDATQLRLGDLRLEAYSGELMGRAVLPLQDSAAGRADLTWREIDLGRLAAEFTELPAALEGSARGELAAELRPADASGQRDWSLSSSIQAPELRLGPAALGGVRGDLSRRAGMLEYGLRGDLLGGSVALDGRWSHDARPPETAVDEGRLTLAGLKLDRLWAAAVGAGGESPLSATMGADMAYQHRADDGLPAGSGTVELEELRWQDVAVADRLEARVRWAGTQLSVDPLTGTFAGGTLRFASRGPLLPRPRQAFELSLRGGELERLLAPWPLIESRIGGRVDLGLRGVVSDGVEAEGRVSVPRTRVDGQRLSNLRVPLRVGYDPRTGAVRLRLRDVAAEAAGGRLTGDLQVSLARTIDVDGGAKFSQLDAEALFGPELALGDGRVSGSITVEGRRVAALDDLDARIEARLLRARARSIPLVQLVQPFLVSRLSAGEVVDAGELRARLRRGVVTVEKFSLDDESFQLFATGTVIPGGRLNLEVAVHTRPTGPNRFLGQFLLDRLPAVGPLPLTIAAQANRLLSNRVVYLEVTGTMGNPTVRVQAWRLLEEEALRLFLGSFRR